ncbi:ATP-binding protein [Streptomyces katrae]|uniref:ATP-binding protein n=1 Tax=Streptomyces katrae TaxID=68223 RepID=UPI0004C0481E|nr:ATP-binding protein [Streptomyces katrae]
MGGVGTDEQPEPSRPGPIAASFLLNEWERIADARRLARSFLDEVQILDGLPVSARAVEVVELIVSELVTNARKYAPGPNRLTLEVIGGCLEVSVWDSNPTPPAILPPDPLRIGQHGLEVVIASAKGFKIYREPTGKRITAVVLLVDAHQCTHDL